MHATLAFPSADLAALLETREFGHVIDGRVEAALGDRTWLVRNPSNGETLVEVPLGSSEDVDRAVDVARRALPAWRRRTPADRAGVLLALADLVDDNSETFAQLESLNVGKPLMVSRPEIPGISDVLRFMSAAIRTAQAPVAEEYAAGTLSMLRREPIGVVGAITPWNYPLVTAVWKLAPALAAGNTVVLKPSELTPLSTILFLDMARDLLPPGVVNIVLGTGPDVGHALAVHPGIDMVSLTGSIPSGVAVARGGAENLKRVHLELGGKAPVVVFEDADLDGVVDAIRTMGFWNTGQECGAATRVLCARGIHDDLVARLRDKIASLKVGAPNDGDDVEMGPLISEVQRQRVDEIVQAAIDGGATAETGGGPGDSSGFFYQPTLLTHIPDGSPALRTEIFGPVVTVEAFETEDEAIEQANNSSYGLAASIWTESGRRAIRLSEALNYGTVWVNTHLVVATEMPWAGFGMSGSGRELSTYAIDEFSRTKHVVMAK